MNHHGLRLKPVLSWSNKNWVYCWQLSRRLPCGVLPCGYSWPARWSLLPAIFSFILWQTRCTAWHLARSFYPWFLWVRVYIARLRVCVCVCVCWRCFLYGMIHFMRDILFYDIDKCARLCWWFCRWLVWVCAQVHLVWVCAQVHTCSSNWCERAWISSSIACDIGIKTKRKATVCFFKHIIILKKHRVIDVD